MDEKAAFFPKSFAVIGAGPVGCIVAAFLARGGYEVTLCDVIPALIEPAMSPGILIEGAENLQQPVTRVGTQIAELADHLPDVIFITVKANVLPLISSAIEGFYREGMYIISWQNGIDTELEIAKVLGRKPVMRAVVNYGCGLIKPGHVKMPFHHPPHYLQELDENSRPAVVAISEALSSTGLHANRHDLPWADYDGHYIANRRLTITAANGEVWYEQSLAEIDNLRLLVDLLRDYTHEGTG